MIFLFFSSMFSQNILSLEYLGGDSLYVKSTTVSPIGGFQFVLDGIDIYSVSMPDIISAGFNISFNSTTVTIFSFTGAIIPSGNNILAVVYFDSESINGNICFDDECFDNTSGNSGIFYDCALSSIGGGYLPIENYTSDLDYCAEGCFNESACNFLDSNECQLPITYYQDADNDELGNPDISEDSCELIDGYVTNSDDDNDNCSGAISAIDESCCLSSTFDTCGVCDGTNADMDCAGECFGVAEEDCAGVCEGTAAIDACGLCDGDGSSCAGCDGVSNSGVTEDACGNCSGDCIEDNNGLIVCSGITNTPENLVISDCFGVCGGSAYIDSCDSCVGGDTGESQCLSLDVNMVYKVSITSAYPNPFNPSINIEYSVASVGHVILQIIALDGKHIDTITNSIQTQGLYNVQWTPDNVPSGMYLVQLNANNQIQNKKILYLK